MAELCPLDRAARPLAFDEGGRGPKPFEERFGRLSEVAPEGAAANFLARSLRSASSAARKSRMSFRASRARTFAFFSSPTRGDSSTRFVGVFGIFS